MSETKLRRPEWIKVRLENTGEFREIQSLVKDLRLNTVCEDARCPNIGECWGAGTATFMILGERCIRGCGFCSVGLPADSRKRLQTLEQFSELGSYCLFCWLG
jgi:lipoic acid synthetase